MKRVYFTIIFLAVVVPFVGSPLWAYSRGRNYRIHKVVLSKKAIVVPSIKSAKIIPQAKSKISSPLALNDCIKLALERNAKLIAAGYDIDASGFRVIEAKAAFWPVLEYKYRMAPAPTDVDNAFDSFFRGDLTLFNSIHVGVGVPITTFGQLHTAKQLAEGGVKISKFKLEEMKYETAYQIKKIYYGIQFADETIHLLNGAITKLTDRIDDEEAKEIKDMDPYDLLKAKAFRNDLKQKCDEVRQNRRLAYDALKLQMGLDESATIKLANYHLKPLMYKFKKQKLFIEAARQSEPKSNMIDVGLELKRKQYLLEKKKLLPSLGMGFFFDFGRSAQDIKGLKLTDDFNDPFNYTRAGIGLQLKGKLDFHGAYARIKKAKAEYLGASYKANIARQGINLDMKRAYLTAMRLKDEVARAKEAKSIARQMVFLSKLNIDTGIGDETKYTDALKLFLLNRGKYFKAIYQFDMAVADLEKRIGKAEYEKLVSRQSTSVFSSDEIKDGPCQDDYNMEE